MTEVNTDQDVSGSDQDTMRTSTHMAEYWLPFIHPRLAFQMALGSCKKEE